MPRVSRFELMSVDLPFRRAFRHAAAARTSSESLFVKCVTDTGAVGFGECLPRAYVTGETRDDAFVLLWRAILPELIGMEFSSLADVQQFLAGSDGRAPHLAAWCAVDLALLDAFGRAFQVPVRLGETVGVCPRYSAVVSADGGWGTLIKLRLFGFDQVKLKVGQGDVPASGRLARRLLGHDCELRVDANMAWDAPGALQNIRALQGVGIHCVEQPVPANDWEGLAMLVRETNAEIIADESFSDRASLTRLIERRACTGVNVRISKCGGLIAAARRCAEASRAGLTVQIGCQVGESSLLSAAQLILISAVREARYLEGCYGKHLLRIDPVHPCLQLGYGGRAPRLPEAAGLGVEVDENELNRWVQKRVLITKEEEGGNDVAGGQSDDVADRAVDGQRV